MELLNKPGIIISDKIIKTTKVKKYIDKNKISYSDIIYLEDIPSDFRELDRALVNLENKYLGKKEVTKIEREPALFSKEYIKKYDWWYVGALNPIRVILVPPNRIDEYDGFKTQDYDEYVKWYYDQLAAKVRLVSTESDPSC